jgi:hypothetical protein
MQTARLTGARFCCTPAAQQVHSTTDHTPAAQGASAWERHRGEVDRLGGRLQQLQAAMGVREKGLRVSLS